MKHMHHFHIPVMGLSFTVDTPLKVARYGISSVVSIGNDTLLEDMRRFYSDKFNIKYEPVSEKSEDARARRITAYLNLLDELVSNQIEEVRNASLETKSELVKYLEMLPENSVLKDKYVHYIETIDPVIKEECEAYIREHVAAGSIDVNIMTKLNKPNHDAKGNLLPPEYADALSALRGFANSTLNSAVVFSAGFNPRLYGYLDQFADFFPDENGHIKKRVILKVSDFRSALIQGKYLAKRGIWISEFRIESGLNCGGHAFPTEGLLMGPILETFKNNRESLREELFDLCMPYWMKREETMIPDDLNFNVSVQGGIGTAKEHAFLREHFGVDSAGWGTPFLLVPEATTVDDVTMDKLVRAKNEDLYLSKSSPLGVPFNNLRESASELKREKRIKSGRPGSPCLKKHLVSNTEFTKEPVCTASRKYQHFKIKELNEKGLEGENYQEAYEDIVVKSCLCEDLSGSAYINYEMQAKIKPEPAICPGPNLAFFSQKYSLQEMVDHIYGRINLLNDLHRPHMFLNELKMYVEYLEGEWGKASVHIDEKKAKYLSGFKKNLQEGIKFYDEISSKIDLASFEKDLQELAAKLDQVKVATVTAN